MTLGIHFNIRTVTVAAVNRRRAWLLKYLKQTQAQKLVQAGELALLKAFRQTAARVPAYQQILQKHQLDFRDIKTIEDFQQRVPILDKQSTFGRFSLPQLCLDGNTNDIVSVLNSSGHSGLFSFSVNTAQSLITSARSIDLGLQYAFGVDVKNSILINALPMGVKVRTERAVLSETSVREDMVWATVKYFGPHYEQIIIVVEGSFVKKIIEEGPDHGVDWSRFKIHIVIGEEGITEGWRSYIASLLGHNFTQPEKGLIASSMGVAELDLNIFHETFDTIRIRRLALANDQLRQALFGSDTKALPMFFQYYPHRTFVETSQPEKFRSELVVSMLSTELKLPLIRYNTKDVGRVYSYAEVVSILTKTLPEVIWPELRLPFVAVWGRGEGVRVGAYFVTPEEVKEAIYSDFLIAAATTGNFKMTLSADKKTLLLYIQAKQGQELNARLKEMLETGVGRLTGAPVEVKWYSWEEFPWNVNVDYERKFNYFLEDR